MQFKKKLKIQFLFILILSIFCLSFVSADLISIGTEEIIERNIGNMISVLVKGFQQLFDWNIEQDARIDMLENELCKKNNSYSFCEIGIIK